MKHEPTADDTLDIDDSPVKLRLPAGSTLFTISGEAWITQEGMRDDVILAAGQRFDVARRDEIVISATRGRALLYVARPLGTCQRAFASIHDFARCRARELRRAELDRLGEALIGVLRGVARRVLRAPLQRPSLAPRPRLDTH